MSVDQRNIIDAVSTKPSGEVMLTISDHLEWEYEESHFVILQDKINDYLAFIETGQLFEIYPSAKGSFIIIRTMFKYPPTNVALDFLIRCKNQITDIGLGFEWNTFTPEATA